MLNRSASLAMSTSVLKALPGKLDIKRHSPSILYFLLHGIFMTKIDLFSIIYSFKSEKFVNCMALYMIEHYVISILTKHFALRYNKENQYQPFVFSSTRRLKI